MNSHTIFANALSVIAIFIHFLFFATVVRTAFVRPVWIYFRRPGQLRDLAKRYGLQYLGRELPGIYPGNALDDMPSWDYAQNVIFGEVEGDLFLAFDVRIGFGRNGFNRTIVACLAEGIRSTPVLPLGFRHEDAGQWRSVYRSWSFVPGATMIGTKRIEELWMLLRSPRAIRDHSRPSKIATVPGNLFIRPRKR
jgi:hypothetical protein